MSGLPALRTVRASNPSPMTLDGTRTFIVGRRLPAVIDPGPNDAAHLRALEEALGGATPAAILLTHAHADHAAAAEPIARRTGAPVWMAPGALHPPLAASLVAHWVEEGDEVETDAGTLRAVATPGHVPEHVAYWWRGEAAPPGGGLFVGDLLMGEGDTTLVAPPEGDLAAYLRSLDRVEALAPGVLFPTHGPAIEDPAGAIRRYRDHRRLRIVQVKAACLASPGVSAADLVESIYGTELHPGLRRAAEGSIRAILEYLRAPAAG